MGLELGHEYGNDRMPSSLRDVRKENIPITRLQQICAWKKGQSRIWYVFTLVHFIIVQMTETRTTGGEIYTTPKIHHITKKKHQTRARNDTGFWYLGGYYAYIGI